MLEPQNVVLILLPNLIHIHTQPLYHGWSSLRLVQSLTLFHRIYPKGTRFDSSNYDPVPFWNVGAQFVALVRPHRRQYSPFMHLL